MTDGPIGQLARGTTVIVTATQEDGETIELRGTLISDWHRGRDVRFKGGYVPADRLIDMTVDSGRPVDHLPPRVGLHTLSPAAREAYHRGFEVRQARGDD